MNFTAQRWFAWSGIFFVLVFFVGMALAGMLPPHPPSDTPAEAAAHWSRNPGLRELGLLLCIVSTVPNMSLAAVISVYLKRIEPNGMFSNFQLLGAATGAMAILVPMWIFAAAAFRPGVRPDEIIQALNDTAWMPFVANFPPAVAQVLAVGFAALSDRRASPVMPRWFGYYSIWTAILFLPGGLILFFKDGPFAWNGVISFWMVAVLFGAWYCTVTWALLKAITQAEQQSLISAADGAADC